MRVFQSFAFFLLFASLGVLPACGGRQQASADEQLAWTDIYYAVPAHVIGVLGKYSGEGALPFDLGDDTFDDMIGELTVTENLSIEKEQLNGEVLKFLTTTQEFEIIGVHNPAEVMATLREHYANNAGYEDFEETRHGKRPILFAKGVPDWGAQNGNGLEITAIGNRIIRVSTSLKGLQEDEDWMAQSEQSVQALIQGWPDTTRFAETLLGKQLRPHQDAQGSRGVWVGINTAEINKLAENAQDEPFSPLCQEANQWFQELVPGGGITAYTQDGQSILEYRVHLSDKARDVLTQAIPKAISMDAIRKNSLLSLGWAMDYKKIRESIHINPDYLECDAPVTALSVFTENGAPLGLLGVLPSLLLGDVIDYIGTSGAIVLERINLGGMIPLPAVGAVMDSPDAEGMVRELIQDMADEEGLTIVSENDPFIIEFTDDELPSFFKLHVEAHSDHLVGFLGDISETVRDLLSKPQQESNASKSVFSAHINRERVQQFTQELDQYARDMEMDNDDYQSLKQVLDHIQGGGSFELGLDASGISGRVHIGNH